MTLRFFTLAEANALLPKIRPLVRQLLKHQARVAATHQEVNILLEHAHLNVGNATASQMVRDFRAIERLVKQIRSYGCDVRDIRVGVVEFLSEVNGLEVYLSWQHNEAEIKYYHDFSTDFTERKPLPTSNNFPDE